MAWNSINVQPPTYNVHQKFKAVRCALIKWNHDTFGDIFNRKNGIEGKAERLENELLLGWNNVTFGQWMDVKQRWRDVCGQEEIYWKQKGRLHRHKGDANANFFHAMNRSRIAASRLDSIVDENGNVLNGYDVIHDAMINYFEQFFSTHPYALDMELLELIPTLVSDDDNGMLLTDFTLEELKDALASIPLDASPGLDGFAAASLAILGG